MEYTTTIRRKLPRNKYGDVNIASNVIIQGGGSGGSSGGGGGGGQYYSEFTPATASAAGQAGLVPAPSAGMTVGAYMLNAVDASWHRYSLLEAVGYSRGAVIPLSTTYTLGSSTSPFSAAYFRRWQPTSDASTYIEYDSTYGAFKVSGSIYATGSVSAGGYNGTSSGGGGGGSDVNVLIASSLSSSATTSNIIAADTGTTFNAYTVNYLHRRIAALETNPVDTTGLVTASQLQAVADSLASSIAERPTYSYVDNKFVSKEQLSAQSYLVKTGDTMLGDLGMAAGTKIVFNQSPASYIQYDSSVGALMVYGGLYATGALAAGGYSGTGSGSGSGTSTDTNTWRPFSVNGTSWKSSAITSGGANLIAGNGISLTAAGTNLTVSSYTTASTEWYNIKTAKIKNETSGKYELFTMIENFSGSPMSENFQSSGSKTYVDPTKYRLVLMTFKKERGGRSRAWRVPMFSAYWNWGASNSAVSKTHPSSNSTPVPRFAWNRTWWNIEGTKNQYFKNMSLTSSYPAWDTVFPTTSDNMKLYDGAYVWKGIRNRKKRFGCAVYKYTGEGKYGWHRVSNISYVEMFLTKNGDVQLEVKE